MTSVVASPYDKGARCAIPSPAALCQHSASSTRASSPYELAGRDSAPCRRWSWGRVERANASVAGGGTEGSPIGGPNDRETTTVRAELIRPQELGPAQIERWRSIIDNQTGYHSPFYAPEFTQAVAEARDDAFVAVLEDAGETVGFFPFHRLHRGVAKPIGGPISDYHGPILANGFDPDPAWLLNACGLASYDFNHLPAAIARFSAGAFATSQSPMINLEAGYDGYKSKASKRVKNELSNTRRRRRKMEREVGPISFAYHETSDALYEQFIILKNKQFRALGVQSAFSIPWIAKTLDIIRQSQFPGLSGVFSTLHAGEKLMAAHFGMRSKTVLHWWFPTYDREASAYGSGIILLTELASCADEEGFSSIDLGRGDEIYKARLKTNEIQLCEGSIERPATLPGMLRTGQKVLLSAARPLPLGRFESYPRRALARLISGMSLP